MQKQKKILFLHGFYASGSCVPALALKEAFDKRATVLTPDLPLHPADAVRLIRDICDQEKPDILVGNSCGSFYAQMISPIIGVPALLGNPHFKMSDFLRERIGNHQYKSPRANGIQDFTIDEQLIKEFEEMEKHQFDCCNIYNMVRVWGIFGEEDTLAHFEPLFLEHYHSTFHFPRWPYPNGRAIQDVVLSAYREADVGISHFRRPRKILPALQGKQIQTGAYCV